ncbi:MAG: hypothetical protein Kow0010_20890 [Dehalococcoidia bacterium]
MSIAYGGIIAFFFRGVHLAVAFALVLVTSAELGGAGRGTFILGVTAIGIVTALTNGLTAAAAYQVSNRRRHPVDVLASAAAPALGAVAVVFAAGALARAVFSGDIAAIAIPVAAGAGAIVVNSTISGVLLGQEAFVRYNASQVLPVACSLAGVAATFWLLDRTTPTAALTAYAVGQWVAFPVLLSFAVRRFPGRPGFDWPLARSLATFGVVAALAATVSYLNYRADLFVVEHFEGREGVGVYGNAVYVAEALWNLSGALALAAYARIGSAEREAAAQLTARVMRHTLLILGAVSVGLFALAGILVDLVFPEEFRGMVTPIRLLLPGTLIFGLAAAFSGYFTYQLGRPWASLVVASTALAVDIALAIALVPAMGIDGAALATTVSYVCAMGLALAWFARSSGMGMANVFRYSRADFDDYRTLVGRLRAAVGG